MRNDKKNSLYNSLSLRHRVHNWRLRKEHGNAESSGRRVELKVRDIENWWNDLRYILVRVPRVVIPQTFTRDCYIIRFICNGRHVTHILSLYINSLYGYMA